MKRRNYLCTDCGRVETLSFWPDCCSSCRGSVYPEQQLETDGVFMPFHDTFELFETTIEGQPAQAAA